jgi:protein gp37
MNKTSIEWCTHSWNPMTGCLHGCPYCYARKIAERFKGSKAWPIGFKPMFHPERLGEPFDTKQPAIIFCGSMTDVFGDWWTSEQIREVLLVIIRNPQHRFVILTKNPGRAIEILKDYSPEELSHVYFGTSTTGDITERTRLLYIREVHQKGFKTVISFEPLLHDPVDLFKSIGGVGGDVDWVIVGYQTNPVKIPPTQSKCAIRDYVVADCGTPLFIKDNAIPKGCRRTNPCDEYGNAGTHWWPADLLPIAQAWGKA